MSLRIIPRLDIKNETLVKGIQLEGLRVLGTPYDFAKYYFDTGADELLYIDAVASLYGRNSLLEMISRTAESIFIPITVGGGIRTLDDIRAVLAAGGDKVAINTAALEREQLLDEAVKEFGSSTIVLSIQAKRSSSGEYRALVNNGRDDSGRNVLDWAREGVDRGVGEVLVTSIDREGTGRGFDTELVEMLATALPVPLVACGGAGKVEHVTAVAAAKADAISCAAILHYHALDRFEETSLKALRTTETLLQRNVKSGADRVPAGVPELKNALAEAGFDVRPAHADLVAS